MTAFEFLIVVVNVGALWFIHRRLLRMEEIHQMMGVWVSDRRGAGCLPDTPSLNRPHQTTMIH